MDLHDVFQEIKELGHSNTKRENLRKICTERIEQILIRLPHRILSNDTEDVLDCLLNGFSDNSSHSINNKVKIINIVLTVMRKESTSLSHCGNVISRLCLELPKLPVQDLVRWSDESVQSIVNDSDVNMIWGDIFPECMYTILTQTTIKHCGTEMTSENYKEQCVRTLCQCQWKERQLVTLVSMFKDLHLNQNDHKQVVNKICSYIIDIPPDTLPPLVHQVLKLCKSHNLEIVLSHLSYYFTCRLYSKLEPSPHNSESTTMDIDDIVPYSVTELSSCLSTCLYHITKGPAEPDLVRKHVKAWPRTQLLRTPFVIDLALAISDKGSDFRTACLDVIKSAIEQRILDEMRGKESAWLQSVLPPDVDIASLLKVLTTESGNHRQLTAMGLINLAFSLLSVNAGRATAPSCWSHGKLILVRLSKSQPETAPHILAKLGDRLAGECTQIQFADCLYVLCKLTPVSVERCTQLATILENCQPSTTDYKNAAAVLDAVRPLLNYSTRTRDVLVMVCRKGLYSRSSLHRCLALSGFMTVLRNIKLSNATPSSNVSQSWQSEDTCSYLTQLTVEFHSAETRTVASRVRNEAVCMEVVSILRRCLVQDANVKQLLYTKLYDCTKEKSALQQPVLELLYEHLEKYISDDNEVSPLLLDKCVQLTAIGANLTEPISHLIYVIAQFLQPAEEEDLEDILSSQTRDVSNTHLKNKLNFIMNRLCESERLGIVDMEDPGLTDLTPESKAKYLKVQQILQCYEVLVAHKIIQWTPQSSGIADSVYQLYKISNNILEQTKTPTKSKKGNKSLNDTRQTTKSQKSQKSQNEKGKAPIKLNNMLKDRAGPFKPLPGVWDMKFCLRVVKLLYSEDVPWSSTSERNSLRGRRDFHQWTLRCMLSVLSADSIEKRIVSTYVKSIAAVIYNRCICRFEDVCNFDDQSALLCVDVFKTCLSLLFSQNYSLKLEPFLPNIIDEAESTPTDCVSKILDRIHHALAQILSDAVGNEGDAVGKKLSASLCGLASMLLTVPVASSGNLFNVINKYEDYLRRSEMDCLLLITPVLAAACREQLEAQFLEDLLKKLLTTLGNIDEQEEDSNESSADFPTIDSGTGHNVLIQVCSHLNTRFEHVDHLLNRARDLVSAESVATRFHRERISKEITEVYKSIVLQMCRLCYWTCACAKMRCSVGAPSDKLLSTCLMLYKMLAKLAKQIDVATAQIARFERLLKLSGKKLSTVMDVLITYVEASQEQVNANKVLKRTKLIPALVYEAEQFSNQVLTMANKAKLNWQHYMSLGTARDFRIKVPVLQEALQTRGNEESEGSDDDNADAETVVLQALPEQTEKASKPKRRRVS